VGRKSEKPEFDCPPGTYIYRIYKKQRPALRLSAQYPILLHIDGFFFKVKAEGA